MKEYEILSYPIKDRYKTSIAKWHRRRLRNMAYGCRFNEEKPFNSNKTKDTVERNLTSAGEKVEKFFSKLF
jgi:hypothetical protein